MCSQTELLWKIEYSSHQIEYQDHSFSFEIWRGVSTLTKKILPQYPPLIRVHRTKHAKTYQKKDYLGLLTMGQSYGWKQPSLTRQAITLTMLDIAKAYSNGGTPLQPFKEPLLDTIRLRDTCTLPGMLDELGFLPGETDSVPYQFTFAIDIKQNGDRLYWTVNNSGRISRAEYVNDRHVVTYCNVFIPEEASYKRSLTAAKQILKQKEIENGTGNNSRDYPLLPYRV